MNNVELLPSEENLRITLKENILQRNKDVVRFYSLLKSLECSNMIALDGRWGSGKTFFVKHTMCVVNALNPASSMSSADRENITNSCGLKINEEDTGEACQLAVYYDAWANDNDTDPILSLIYEITKQLSIEYNIHENSIFKIAGSIVEVLSGRNVNGILDALKSEDPFSKFKEEKAVEDKLKSFFTEILSERGNRLIVFIDELDRCKPSFAIQLLERIKHYLADDRITFVLSVNIDELQHTIKKYYGNDFDACRYLDRFFSIRLSLPKADMRFYFDRLGLNGSYAVEKVMKRVIKMLGFELREINRYYQQVKTAIYVPTHGNTRYDFSFSDGKAREIVLLYVVPLLIALKMYDISLYDDFVNGKNSRPLVDLFDCEEMSYWILDHMLSRNESFVEDGDKILVTHEEVINRFYDAIFVNSYETSKYYEKTLGEYTFDASTKQFAINAASLLSNYADYSL